MAFIRGCSCPFKVMVVPIMGQAANQKKAGMGEAIGYGAIETLMMFRRRRAGRFWARLSVDIATLKPIW